MTNFRKARVLHGHGIISLHGKKPAEFSAGFFIPIKNYFFSSVFTTSLPS